MEALAAREREVNVSCNDSPELIVLLGQKVKRGSARLKFSFKLEHETSSNSLSWKLNPVQYQEYGNYLFET